MVLLSIGVLLFAVVHFVPSLMPELKQAGLSKLGDGGYKGVFSLLLLGSFALMIVGWRSAEVTYLYQPPAALRTIALALMLAAFVLLAASSLKSRIKQFIRHPQLTGVALWSVAHLMLNGDSRSAVLFVGLGLWAILSILLINRRDGAWTKDEVPPMAAEFVLLATAAVTIAVTIYIHPWISGVNVF
ncbi:MAG: NnrU family protein [Halioglobus sp.]